MFDLQTNRIFSASGHAHPLYLAGCGCWRNQCFHHFSSISHVCIRQVLKKTELRPLGKKRGVFRRKPQRRSSLRWRILEISASSRPGTSCSVFDDNESNNISKTRETRYRWLQADIALIIHLTVSNCS